MSISAGARVHWHSNPRKIGVVQKMADVVPDPQTIISYALVLWDDFQVVPLWYRADDLAVVGEQPEQQSLWEVAS